MEKELQEVSSFLTLSCNVIPCARVATRKIHQIEDSHKWMLDFFSDFWGLLLSIPLSSLLQGAMPSKVACKGHFQQKICFWGI